MEHTYDYIIVGAGGSGATLAYRLSEDPTVTVLLLERGAPALNPLIYVPKGFYFLMGDASAVHPYMAQNVANPQFPEAWMRGTVVGGSTSVNGMMYLRGEEHNYQDLAATTSQDWGWQRFLSAFKSFEDHSLGASAMRGADGPLGVTVDNDHREVTDMVFAAAAAMGVRYVDDINADSGEHIGNTPETTRNAIRQSTGNTFLRAAAKRPNLTIVPRAHVGYLRFESTPDEARHLDQPRVRGVRARYRGQMFDIDARRDVVLCASTVENPLLLERSGIGRPDVVQAAGVRPTVESPQVGERILEQHGTGIQVRFKRDLGDPTLLNSFPKQMFQGARWLLTRKGPVGTSLADITAHLKSRPELDHADFQVMITPVTMDPDDPHKVGAYPGLSIGGYQISPSTESSVHLSGSSPDIPPVLLANYFDSDGDKRVIGTMVDRLREFTAQAPLADEIAGEEFPGGAVHDAQSSRDFALSPGTTVYHGVGSVAMGSGDDDPVDPTTLRVRGTQGLRVADISILPTQVSGNTAAPAMAIGWLAADVITRT